MNNVDNKPLKIVIQASIDIEFLLSKHWGAKGEGLLEKLETVKEQLPTHLHRGVKLMACMRQQAETGVLELNEKQQARFTRIHQKLKEQIIAKAPEKPASSSSAGELAVIEMTQRQVQGAPQAIASGVAEPSYSWVFWLAIAGALLIVIFIWNLKGTEHENFIAEIAPLYTPAPLDSAHLQSQEHGRLVVSGKEVTMTHDDVILSGAAELDNIENELSTLLSERLKLRIDDPEFKANVDGTYDVQILVHWNTNAEGVVTLLEPYFNLEHDASKGILTIKKYDNIEQKQKKNYSEYLYYSLSSKRIKLQLSIDDVTQDITLVTGRDCYLSGCEGVGDSEIQIQYSNFKKPNSLLYASHLGEQNPVVLKKLTKKRLLQGVNIKADLIVEDNVIALDHFDFESINLKKTLYESKVEQDAAFENINNTLFQKIHDKIKIYSSEPVYEQRDNGLVDVSVNVQWALDPAFMYRIFSLYFSYPDALSESNVIRIKKLDNERERQKKPFTEVLYHELVQYKAGLKISLGERVKYITFASGMKCFAGCTDVGISEYHILFNNKANPSEILLNGYLGERNPVIFENVTESEAQEDIEIEYYWEKI